MLNIIILIFRTRIQSGGLSRTIHRLMEVSDLKIGVLAMQGAFEEHIKMLRNMGIEAVEVRLKEQLDDLDGLIIPGGESTTIGKMLIRYDMLEKLKQKGQDGFPIFGTCAGMIMLSGDIKDGLPGQPGLDLLNASVVRNAFGRQVDSFESELEVPALGEKLFPAVFIRAPLIIGIKNNARVLARFQDRIVAVEEGNLLATAFHPELTGDDRFHRYFVDMIERGGKKNG